jgi:hypothetical protein
MYRMVNKAELAVVPNADHFTMAQQFDIAAMVLLNFAERVIGSNKKHNKGGGEIQVCEPS